MRNVRRAKVEYISIVVTMLKKAKAYGNERTSEAGICFELLIAIHVSTANQKLLRSLRAYLYDIYDFNGTTLIGSNLKT